MNPNERCANVTALDRKGRRPIKVGRTDPASHAAKPLERGPPKGVVPPTPSPNPEGTAPMSSTDTDRPGAGRRGSGSADADAIADQIDAIRTDLQNLTSTVGRIANKQLNRAQDKAIATASEAEEAIRRNPLQAVAIAIGVGFLFGVLTRR
jgi:ElaB/YqjD/DUF883 family membrane-anchored ribosome-binding protein